MTERELNAYAAVLVDTCLDFKSGGRLRIACEAVNRELALACARRAYELGARAVRIDWADMRLARAQAELLREEWLDDKPLLTERIFDAYVEEGWSALNILGEEDPSLMEGADPARLQRLGRARSLAVKKYHDAVISNRIAWCVAPSPTAAWGKAVFEGSKRPVPADPEAALWKELVPILRLDAPEPARAVREHMEALQERARRLDELSLRAVRFKGPGTDLTVVVAPASKWIGGGSTTPDGRNFYPNLPTEEVFCSPDWRGTEGRAACTRPFDLYGQKVRGAWIEFRAGELVDFGADENAGALARWVETDPGARRLGELALVDGSGPIFRSGLVYGNALIDENAACHVALGSAYEEAFRGIETVPEGERTKLGFNESMVHEDLMIGSDAVEVTGVDAAGREVPLISKGRFAI